MKLVGNLVATSLCFSAIALAAASVRADGYDAHAYVTSGLVAQWDGIDNAGTGSHDATATTWKDLSGNGHDASRPDGGVIPWAGGNSMARPNGDTTDVVKTGDITLNVDTAFTFDFCGVCATKAASYIL